MHLPTNKRIATKICNESICDHGQKVTIVHCLWRNTPLSHVRFCWIECLFSCCCWQVFDYDYFSRLMMDRFWWALSDLFDSPPLKSLKRYKNVEAIHLKYSTRFQTWNEIEMRRWEKKSKWQWKINGNALYQRNSSIQLFIPWCSLWACVFECTSSSSSSWWSFVQRLIDSP